MKTLASVLAGAFIMASLVGGGYILELQKENVACKSDKIMPLNEGAFLMSEFVAFKKENMREDLSIANKISDKVWFKAFVIEKKSEVKACK